MKKVLSLALLTITMGTLAFGAVGAQAPEIDANSAASAVALLSGALMVLRSRRRN